MLKYIEITWGKRSSGDCVIERKGSYDGVKWKKISKETCQFLANDGYVKDADFVNFFGRKHYTRELFVKQTTETTQKFKI